MSDSIVLSFSLLFAAVIALICAVYVALSYNKKKEEPKVDNN
jgi:hypothetical protein